MKYLPLMIFTFLLLPAFSWETNAATQAQYSEASSEDSVDSINSAKKHSLSTEFLGRGGLYSFNYDYLLKDNLALGIGAANYSVSIGTASASTWIIPVYANYYFTKNPKHRWFATGGLNLISSSASADGEGQVKGSGIAEVIGAGYEYKGDNGFLFRAAPYVMLGKMSGGWFGVSLGYSI